MLTGDGKGSAKGEGNHSTLDGGAGNKTNVRGCRISEIESSGESIRKGQSGGTGSTCCSV